MSEIWFKRPTIVDLDGVHVQTAVEWLGIEYLEVGDDFITARMPVDHRTTQPYGVIYGGVSMVLAETLASSAANACVDRSRFQCFGQEINGNHLRPCSSGWVTGITRPIHLGRRSQVWSIEMRDEKGRMTCIARMTAAVVEIG